MPNRVERQAQAVQWEALWVLAMKTPEEAAEDEALTPAEEEVLGASCQKDQTQHIEHWIGLFLSSPQQPTRLIFFTSHPNVRKDVI
jgi:hypothetical protein